MLVGARQSGEAVRHERASLLVLLALVLLLLPPRRGISSPAGDTPPEKPNIVWIIAENISLDLGCYGQRSVHTPNADRLAREGMLYWRAYATSPVCAPSRSAFFTGMYQTTIDCHHMRSHRDDDYRLPEGVRCITHRLQRAGYFTANIRDIGGHTVGTGKLDLNFVNEGPIYQSESWEEAVRHRPFFAVFNLPEVEYDIYDRQTYRLERVPLVGEETHPRIATPENVDPPPYYPDHPLVRQEWARYLNAVSGMDLRIGTILSAIERAGLLEDTVIFFFADNGRLEPRGIHWCYDSGLHVPLIIRWPRKFPAPPGYRPGRGSDQLVSLIDLTATTLAIAGLEKPMLMHGRIFLGPQAEPPRKYVFAARDRIDETVQRIRSVTDGRYHYIRNFTEGPTFASLNRYKEKCFPIMQLMRRMYREGQLSGAPLRLMELRGPGEELYDLAKDPHEVVNLVRSSAPEHRDALLRLRAALDTWIVETGDRGHIPEPPGTVEEFEREMDRWFGTPEWARR